MGKRIRNVMMEFMNKEYDVLVCTTIIETGLDISNVNNFIVMMWTGWGFLNYITKGRVGRLIVYICLFMLSER